MRNFMMQLRTKDERGNRRPNKGKAFATLNCKLSSLRPERCSRSPAPALFPHLDHPPAGPARPPGAADRVAATAGSPTDEQGLHPAVEPFPVRLEGEQQAGAAEAVARRVDRAELEHPAGDGDVLGPVPRHGSSSSIGTVGRVWSPAEGEPRPGRDDAFLPRTAATPEAGTHCTEVGNRKPRLTSAEVVGIRGAGRRAGATPTSLSQARRRLAAR